MTILETFYQFQGLNRTFQISGSKIEFDIQFQGRNVYFS